MAKKEKSLHKLPRLMKYVVTETGIKMGPKRLLPKTTRRVRPKGRPAGPSGKYFVPGKGPVGVYEWRKWAANEKMLEQMRQAQRYAKMSPQAKAYYAQTGQLPPTQQEQMEQQVQDQVYGQVQQRVMQQPQQQQVRSDNILHAPNFMRGEMVKRPGQEEPNIIGRVVGPTADELPRPIVNPHGDIYMDIDPMSGRPILRKRISEKWLAGRRS